YHHKTNKPQRKYNYEHRPALELTQSIRAREERILELLGELEAILEAVINAEYQKVKGKTVSLGEVCSISSSLIDPRGQQYLDLLHVGGANIESKTGNLIDLKTARQEGLKSSKFVFEETMVLYKKITLYL